MNIFDEDLNCADAATLVETILSERELQVFSYLIKGLSLKLIALDFGVTYKTVRSHRMSILAKLKLNNCIELAILGWRIRKHFVPPPIRHTRYACGRKLASQELY